MKYAVKIRKVQWRKDGCITAVWDLEKSVRAQPHILWFCEIFMDSLDFLAVNILLIQFLFFRVFLFFTVICQCFMNSGWKITTPAEHISIFMLTCFKVVGLSHTNACPTIKNLTTHALMGQVPFWSHLVYKLDWDWTISSHNVFFFSFFFS